ncbi:disease resistance protein RPV1-like [Populus alba]|uniref:disease resistance protein RPV1-like n=1 Tax=Populus alba TaxID=43335 RepID=UPI003CC6FE37
MWIIRNGRTKEAFWRISAFISMFKFVDKVLNILGRTFLHVADYPVGLDSHMHGYCMLSNGSNDVRTVGIRGIGRTGTPVAKAIYNKIANQFESSFFLANVREMSKQNRAVEQQETLLSQIQERKFIAGNLYPGIDAIRDRLCTKKVLIDIDDVSLMNRLPWYRQ